MTQIQLRVSINPGQAEAFINLKRKDGNYERFFAMIDTGAETSLFPERLLKVLDYQLSERGYFQIIQAGIAQQNFEGAEAIITVFLEDMQGNRTPEFKMKAWFAATNRKIIGFEDILDKAVLHLDMPRRTGYLDMTITP